jgi:hypothetical protein
MANEEGQRMDSIENRLSEVLDRLRDLERRLASIASAANPTMRGLGINTRHRNQRTLWSPHQERVVGEEIIKGDDDEAL